MMRTPKSLLFTLLALFLTSTLACSDEDRESELEGDIASLQADLEEKKAMVLASKSQEAKLKEMENKSVDLVTQLGNLQSKIEKFEKLISKSADVLYSAAGETQFIAGSNAFASIIKEEREKLLEEVDAVEVTFKDVATIASDNGRAWEKGGLTLTKEEMVDTTNLEGDRKMIIALLEKEFENMIAYAKNKGFDSFSRDDVAFARYNQIILTAKEKEIGEIDTSNSGGFVLTSSGVTSFNSAVEIGNYARSNGYDPGAAEQGYEMSQKTGGLTSFAGDHAEIPTKISDMISHIKANMNTNGDDLDLVFTIDYSGSMSDDIDAVLNGLDDVANSLAAIIQAGRKIRVAIVTFGEPGLETVDLNFTSDMSKVKDTISSLLSNFSSNQHSTDPGEAWYHGIRLGAEKLSWSSDNRAMITITDEPSYEVSMGDTAYVDATLNALKAGGINSKIYNIIVK